MGRADRQQVGPLYHLKWVKDPIQISSSLIGCSDKFESVFLPVIERRNRGASQEMGSGKGLESGNSRFFFPPIPSTQKERKVRSRNRPFLIKPLYTQTAFQNADSQDGKTIDNVQQLGCLHKLTDAYLHIPIYPISRKYLRFIYDHQVFQFTILPFGMSLSPWVFTRLMSVIATHLRLSAVSLFPYLDDWLIRDLIRN